MTGRSPYTGPIHYEPRRSTEIQRRSNMTQRDEVQKFEQGRIKVLQEERLHIQKKTFTKWMNSFLVKVRLEVHDLFTDLADGKILLKLLEIISGEKLAKPNNGKMRVHKIENVNKSLAFLHTKVRLESIGAEDIVDGNPRLILGLIWTIILRFQIQEIEIDVDEENESSEKKSAKDALLLWAQRKTHGYNGVHITDFSSSWRNGLGFNALIHAHRPDLFDFNDLLNGKPLDNLNHAFDMANNELGIPKLLDAEDIDTTRPDEKSIMTYVASYYHTFARMKNEEKSGRRIAKIISQMVEADKMKNQYDKFTSNLLEWIKAKVVELENRDFPNSLEGIQSLLLAFGQYRTIEKPPKYKERSEIEALYFNINTQLTELKQPTFTPPDGKLVQDIERAWEMLERAEHSREVALRNELRRQERLEQLNYKFEKKSILREGYLKDMIQVLSDPRYGSNLAQVDATVKKHEAISADILAREERFHDLTEMANELLSENYRNSNKVQAREQEVLGKWNYLLELLEKHKFSLNRMGNIMGLLREIDTTLASINLLKTDLSSVDTGAHLFAVEELLQKHALQELQVTSLGETQRKLKRMCENAAQSPKEEELVKRKLNELESAFIELQECSAKRRALLEEARNFYQFLQDIEDEEAWLIEKQRICQAGITAKDLRGVLNLQQKHKLLLDEIKNLKNKFDRLGHTSNQLIQAKHPRSAEIQQQIDNIKKEWEILEKLANERAKQLQDAAEAYQFYADANEADSWLHEKKSLLTSTDYGSDEPSAQALQQRLRDLQGELNAYKGDIQSLNNQAEQLISAGISHLDLTAQVDINEPVEEWSYEIRMIPTEVWEEEEIDKVENRTVIEDKVIPQVRALYPFNDHGFTMAKGDVMILLNKSNPDWWCVRKKTSGVEGFAPANYVKEIEPMVMQVQVRKPQKVKATQKVKKTKMVKQKVPVKIVKQPKGGTEKRKVDDSNSVPKRQKNINDNYNECQELAASRYTQLEDAIRLFGFYRECDDFEKWIKDKEKLLTSDDPNENVEQAKRKYEKFVTDLSASNKRIEALDNQVKDFEERKPAQIDKVRARHRQIHSAWDRLNKLKAQKERSLEGASSVELFTRTCDEAKDWMLEKMAQLEAPIHAHDLKTVQALQRRHQHLERELAPVEEKVNKVDLLANSVKSAYPQEKKNVDERQAEINDFWNQVSEKAADRKKGLENAVGQQIFTNSALALLGWVGDVKEQLNQENPVRDVQTAEELLKNHQDLAHDIKAHDDEFKQVTDLGEQLLKSNPGLTDVADNLERLLAEQEAIHRGWKEKQAWLQQCLQLQNFNKEADHIDAASSSHHAFLEFSDLGNSLDEVEALLKQHRAFANTLVAQDDRVIAFSKKADALIAEQHYDSQGIDDRRNQVLGKRQDVKNLCQSRTYALDASKNYQEFCAEVNDLRGWLQDKLKTASDESYRDLSNLERKLQKHEAFERELRANEGQLRTVNKLGQALIAQDSYKKDEVAKTLKELNDEWQSLVGISVDKGRRLRQAQTQHQYNSSIEDMHNKLNDIEKGFNDPNVGNDLRSCRDLLKKHEMVENELALCNSRVNELGNQSDEMTHDDHFDSSAIQDKALDCNKRLETLDDPARKRREALEESLKYYKFEFELDNELQWIKEHLPLASSELLGQNLHEAQNYDKKHKKLEAEIVGHQPVIDKSLEAGQLLIDQKHPEHQKVKNLCDHLRSAWSDLKEKASLRALKLEQSLKAQQYFSEASEVESWLNEKNDMLSNTDYGRDRDSATKLLTKHKALELELDSYNGIIAEMGRGANALVQSSHPNAKTIAERQTTLEHMLKQLQRKAAWRQQRLMESLFRHEYFVESNELDQWIAEQFQQASSEDYGQDYEHLMLLQAKFDDFKHRVESGSERFRQCEDLAQKLIANESPYSSDIVKKQHQLEGEESEAVTEVAARHAIIRENWERLRQQIDHRQQRLHAAGEIHRFHRDVADALSRIHEKSAALGTELGRDLNSALAFLRRQEAFENELVVLGTQLQNLVEDATRLQHTYPSNKKNIQEKQELVVTAWEGLKERADLRKEQLEASVDLQKFLALARDLTSWASSLRIAMTAQENIRSAARAKALKTEHEALKGEIEAREENFELATEMCAMMEQNENDAAPEAIERCNALYQEREKLHQAWQRRNLYLDQLLDLYNFLRDAKQLENTANAQENILNKSDFGNTVEEVASNFKKHEAFEKLINVQDERLEQLHVLGEMLVEKKHFESPQILSKLADIEDKRIKIKQLCVKRKYQLEDALLYAEFIRDVTDAKAWIFEKQKNLENTIRMGEATKLEEKIKKLQKHQAFQAEVTANESRIDEIKNKGERLLAKKHEASLQIKRQLQDLELAWRKLNQELTLQGKGLEEAQDILEFNNQLDKIEAWIRDKEVMIQAGDTGKDYEHCQALQRKLDDVDSDMRVDDIKIKNINNLADKLIKQGQKGVRERRQEFVNKWHNLQGALGQYRNKLSGALEIHLFNRDVDDTTDRITEKALSMEISDLGRDLNGVEVLQRKHETLETEMSTIKNKIKEHERDAQNLKIKYPDHGRHIQAKIIDLHNQWDELTEMAKKRNKSLSAAYEVQKFYSELKDLEIWVGESIKRMLSQNKPQSVADAKALLELHNEQKAEIDGRREAFAHLGEYGKNLVRKNHAEIKEALITLQDLQLKINEAWEMHKKDLSHEYEVQEFKEQADQLDSWFASKEAFLNNDDVGDNPRAVESLIRKQQDFEITLGQQLSRVNDLEKIGNGILSDANYDNSEVHSELKSILNRRDRLLESTKQRNNKLEESKALHEFIRNIHEVEGWLVQKTQVATDENYREPSNLQSKIQKHSAFDAEIVANTNRINSVIDEGQFLIQNHHFASKEIEARLEELVHDWKQLQELSGLKRDRLNDAYQALMFNRNLDEFESWLNDVEQQLQIQDLGQDLTAVNNLMKKQNGLESDVQQHVETCDNITDQMEKFASVDHFMLEELQMRSDDLILRFNQLQEPLENRREQLEASCLLHQFSRDVDNELEWLNEKEPLASSTDLGNSLTAVQSLQKKHQGLESELVSREPIIAALMTRATHLARSGHVSSKIINDKAIQVKSKLTQVRDLASIRRLRLQDALESQTYYAEASEAEIWCNDKRPLLSSSEVGRDEDSTQTLQRKLEALSLEIDAYKPNINRLSSMSKSLLDRNHFDAKNIIEQQEKIETEFNEIEQLLFERETKLSEALSYFAFLRECNEVIEWLMDQQTKYSSEEYGTDVEHVELLTQQFENVYSSLQNSSSRIENCIEHGNKLIKENGHKDKIETKVRELQDMWNDVLELATARKEALIGARQVHVFDRTADETIGWIQEKESNLNMDVYAQDLEGIQAMVRKHNTFESELKAVKEQIDAIDQESNKLIEQFPDAEDHIAVKRDDAFNAWEDLQTKSNRRKDNLQQAEQLQAYFDQHQEFLAWINEMLAKITAPELPQDVSAAEGLIARHQEYKVEIDSRDGALINFMETGNKLIEQKHFMAPEIYEKITTLDHRINYLKLTWTNRMDIYQKNYDLQMFKRDANLLDSWLSVREGTLRDPKVGESIPQVEELIRKHEDFESTIAAQEDKFNALKRITKIEEEFMKQKEKEAYERQQENERLEQLRRAAHKKRYELERKPELWQEKVDDNAQKEQRPEGPTNITKSNSVAHIFGDRRRGSEANIKRAESMKAATGSKPVKRTPSFTTRRRGSLRQRNENDLPPVEIESFLERKQVLISGGKKAPNRQWKICYSVLCGQLLCFFKNKDDFAASKALCSPIGLHNSTCSIATDYTKRRYTFRLITIDQSEYLFSCTRPEEMTDWVSKISFKARLPPSQQLVSLNFIPKDQHEEVSSQSSRTSSPDVPDSVVLRYDPGINGNAAASHGQRHTFTGDSPPPLPMTQPPNNHAIRRHSTIVDGSNESYGNNALRDGSPKMDWKDRSMPRPSTMQVNDQKSPRWKDMFFSRKKK